MSEFVFLIIGLIVVVVVFSLLWKAGMAATALAPLGPTGRAVVYILALLIAVVVILWFFGRYVGLPL